MWIIYVIDVLGNLKDFLFALMIVGIIVSFFCAESALDGDDLGLSIVKKSLLVILTSIFLMVLIPAKQTMYLMVGAYATEKIVETPEAKEFGNKLLNVVNHKLDKMLEEEDKKK